jgi:carboxypeptidase Taq
VNVPDDRQGCLQDVHWSHGSFGYFPTYSLGSFYAAQYFATACKEIPELKNKIAKGDTTGLHSWLKQRIYSSGRILTSDEICKKATGEHLNVRYFIDHLIEKYTEIYEIQEEVLFTQ